MGTECADKLCKTRESGLVLVLARKSHQLGQVGMDDWGGGGVKTGETAENRMLSVQKGPSSARDGLALVLAGSSHRQR